MHSVRRCRVVSGARGLAQQRGAQIVEQRARAVLAAARIIIAIQESALLGVDQPSAGARGLELTVANETDIRLSSRCMS